MILPSVLFAISALIPHVTIAATDCKLKTQNAYKSSVSENVYYITKSCTKQIFPNESVFFEYFTSWNKVILVDDLTLRFIPNDTDTYVPAKNSSSGNSSSGSSGSSNTPGTDTTERAKTLTVRDGSIIKIAGKGEVYIVINNIKFHIENMATLEELGISTRWIETVSEKTFNAIPTGTSLNVYPNSKIMSAAMPNYILLKDKASPAVYRVEPSSSDPKYQVLRKISNETTLRKFNYRLDRLPSVAINEIPELNLIGVGNKTVLRPGYDLTSNSTITYRGNYEEIIEERQQAKNNGAFLRDEKYEDISFEYPKKYKVVRGFSYASAFRDEYSVILMPPKDENSKLYMIVSPLPKKSSSYTTNDLEQIINDEHNRDTGFESVPNNWVLHSDSDTRRHTAYGYTRITTKELNNGLYEKRISFIYKNQLFTGLIIHTNATGSELEDLLYYVASTFKKTS